MAGDTPFAVDLGKLRKKPKAVDDGQVEAVDRAAAEHGFVQREAGKKRGRAKSPRTGQLHAKVLPHVAEEIAEEARMRGVTQGVLLEEAWAAYQKGRGRN